MKFLELINPERDGLDMVARSVNASEEIANPFRAQVLRPMFYLCALITIAVVFAEPPISAPARRLQINDYSVVICSRVAMSH